MDTTGKSELEDVFPAIPRLPVELERAIFEDAAQISRESIPTSMLIANRVKEWLEPLLYSIVIIHQSSRGPKGYSPPIERLDCYAHHVRHLLVYSLRNTNSSKVIRSLTLCKNLVNVGLWLPFHAPEISAALSLLPLRQFSGYALSLVPNFRTQTSSAQTPFLGLTHIEFFDYGITWARIEWLARLEKLTHLSLPDAPNSELVQNIFTNCSNLRLIVQDDQSEPSGDKRVVHVPLSFAYYSEGWLAQARSERSTWDIAEERVNERL
ncbi:hypothetical protein BDN72DRAFT_961305 [Pluteus cervinus]|uniref:Uncharacterized protein n=1 Tax=Pluteus cervinus TaxID=181527 RepID=A0ACD3ANF5_9AGAR|nr:hypothetical protein BDN72DRAFT_961305 [Pluteus cervinus]